MSTRDHVATVLQEAVAGRCLQCRAYFVFLPNLVPSLKVSREGRRWRLDDKHGQLEPICRECVQATNERLQAKGFLPLPILPGAYLGYIKPRKSRPQPVLSDSQPEILADACKFIDAMAADPEFRKHMRELLTSDSFEGYEKFRAALPIDAETQAAIEWLTDYGVDVELMFKQMFAAASRAGVM